MIFFDNASSDDADSSSSLGNLVLTLAVGTLLYTGWRSLSREQQRKRAHRSEPLPERLQTWEGEIGRAHV